MIWIILALWSLGFVLLWRVPVCPRGSVKNTPLKISLIIPARNEEHNIKRLLDSISTLSLQPFEVIVVDDGSTDRTPEIAREYGALVFPAPPLPDGWRGKTWACWNGSLRAQGETFLFLDADVILKPNAIERIHHAYNRDDRRVLSLGPYHEVEKPYEQFSAMFNLLTFMGMGSFSLTGSPDDPYGLFGPFLLIDRHTYEAIGGHKAVRAEILEHMSLCALLRQRRVKMRCLGGHGVVHIRMYPNGLASLVEGWTKAFASGASKTSPLTLALSAAWITGGMLAFSFSVMSPMVSSLSPMSAITYAAYAVSLYFMLRPIGRFPIWSCALYPLWMLVFFIIFARSALLRQTGGKVTWKGRTIDTSHPEDG